ncbi:MAG: putative N-acetylgalactosaminyl-diphosphoundecaprenol glucuronosyltransferase [Ignavibacteriae bacterium]|nr:MAG: putative N-acetylgalactosaminyl-diphosphoundecaprenol glucuronosyltransferase [Ignavibacteriota bacterium]
MKPTISVIIPCYNYARYLPEAVESVINQTFQDFEIIIVNDGSTDNTQSVAESLIKKYSQYKIRLINQENSGNPAISRNRGIKLSAGKYILCLDADDKLAPTMLEECLNVLKTTPEVAIVYTDRLDFDGEDSVVLAKDYNFEKLKYENHISYCALFKKEVWEKVGGYRTNVIGCEDWDFWIAAGSRGFYGYHINKPLFHYRKHSSGVYQQALRNMRLLKAKIILNNPQVYSEKEILEAKNILKTSNENKTVPLVSVILPTYNRPESLEKALQSLNNQTFQNFEVIIINDGGVDVSQIVEKNNQKNNFIYIYHEFNRGLPAARNTGIKMAQGKYLAYLDDDDIFYPEHLQTLFDVLENTDYKVAFTDSMRAVYKKIDNRLILVSKERFASNDFNLENLFVENYIPIICVMHQKDCLESVGLFDESLTSHEDWDMLIKLAHKYTFKHIPRITCEFSWIDDEIREGKRRIEFLSTLLKVYERYETSDKINVTILQKQKQKLLQSLQWAYRQIVNLQASNSELAAIQNNLSWKILNRYLFRVFDRWIIPFGTKRRALLEKFFRKKADKPEIYTDSQQVKVKKIIKSQINSKEIKKFIIYTHSKGNYFFNEIRDLIKDGLAELGYMVEVKNEADWWYDEPVWHIVVAPHEFFQIGKAKREGSELFPENLILVNTEQPSTKWAYLATEYFPYAKSIWDINFDSAQQILKKGLKCNFLPLGYVENCYLFKEVKILPNNYATYHLDQKIKYKSYFNAGYKNRPIDVSYVGCSTQRRDKFFASCAPVLSKYNTFIHFSEGLNSPVIPGSTTFMNSETTLGIMQRTKISLNIHQGADKYFEWHRIVLLGIAQKNLVVSEPSINSQIFKPNLHFVEAKLKDIPELIDYYLTNEKGIEEANKIIENGYKEFINCRLNKHLQALISELVNESA